MRPTKDELFLRVAAEMATRSTCLRRSVGCVLVDARGHVLSTGYNGRASGLPHCDEVVEELGPPEPNPNPFRHQQGGEPTIRPYVDTYPHQCPGARSPSGTNLDGCEAIHAEQNALLQCRDVYAVDTCYCTHSPCVTCVKLLLNTSCRRVVFSADYTHPAAATIWRTAGREWVRASARA